MGLAKLLLLERLRTPEARFRYREQHRTKKMRNMYSSAFAMRFGMRGMLRNPWMASRMEKITPTRQVSLYLTTKMCPESAVWKFILALDCIKTHQPFIRLWLRCACNWDLFIWVVYEQVTNFSCDKILDVCCFSCRNALWLFHSRLKNETIGISMLYYS